MTLQRKRSFDRELKLNLTPPALPCYLHRRPEVDYYPYYPIRPDETIWVGQHRQIMARQLVAVRELKRTALSDTHRLACILHDNIARPVSFYHTGNQFFVVHEYLYLDIFDLLPLSAMEVSCVFKQVTCGLQSLKEQSIMFGIDSIRLNADGVVKIVLDWDLESIVEDLWREANEGYLMAYLEEILKTMSYSCGHLPSTAASFLESKVLPEMNHPFISHAGGPGVLKTPIQFAIQRKILAGKIQGILS